MNRTTKGAETAKAMQLTSHSELNEETTKFNADAKKHGEAWDKLTEEHNGLIDAAADMTFADFKKKLTSLQAARLKHLQDRLKLCSRRQQALDAMDQELADQVDELRDTMEGVRSEIESKLREAGAGPESTQLWAMGRTNQATRQFNETVQSTYAFVEAQKEWRTARLNHANFRRSNEWETERQVKEDLRSFASNIIGS